MTAIRALAAGRPATWAIIAALCATVGCGNSTDVPFGDGTGGTTASSGNGGSAAGAGGGSAGGNGLGGNGGSDGNCAQDCSQIDTPNDCTVGVCDEGSATCVIVQVADGEPCEDGLYCTGGDSCLGGACTPGPDPCPGPDGDPDCAESCDEPSASCTAYDGDGAGCGDGQYCNGADSCSSGSCSAHAGDPCPGPDGDPDCSESCDEVFNACIANDVTGSACDDGQFCTGPNPPGQTGGDTCQDGTCYSAGLQDCGLTHGDCQVVSCDEASQSCSLVPAADVNTCSDPPPCEVNGYCQNGACEGTPINCASSPASECSFAACNPNTNQCEATAPDPSKQGQPCLGDPCRSFETCDNGLCQGGVPVDCSALTMGCTQGVCNPDSGQCEVAPIPLGGSCSDDGIGPCEEGTCDDAQNCVPTNLPAGTPCDDHAFCTTNDVCDGNAQCAGSPVPSCAIYFEETFESACPPAGWILNPDWQCGVPTSGPGAAYAGTNCLATRLDGNYEPGRAWGTAYAQTPSIDLTGTTSPVLGYWAWMNTEGFSFDGYNLKVSSDGGATFSLLEATPPYNAAVGGQQAWGGDESAAGWQQVAADLSAYQGQTVILRFDFRSDFSVQRPGVYIDDVIVSAGAWAPLAITTASPLPDAAADVTYSHTMTRSGGTPSSEWSIVGGSNHGWLAIDPVTGVLSGTPLAANIGPATVIVHVEEPSDPSDFDEQSFDLEVIAIAITTPNPLPMAATDTPYGYPMTRSGGSASAEWSIVGGSNHDWLTIDPFTGLLSGTPLASSLGFVTVVIHVEEPSDPANFDEATFDLEVVPPGSFGDFEGPCPNGWVLGGDWQCGAPTSGPGWAHSGNQCLATILDGYYNPNQAWLVATATSPPLDLTMAVSPRLTWWVWLRTEAGFDGTNLEISTDDGLSWQLVTAVTPPYNATVAGQACWSGDQSGSGWQPFEADLAAYVGQVVLVQFAFRSDNSVQNPGVYIDDVVLTE